MVHLQQLGVAAVSLGSAASSTPIGGRPGGEAPSTPSGSNYIAGRLNAPATPMYSTELKVYPGTLIKGPTFFRNPDNSWGGITGEVVPDGHWTHTGNSTEHLHQGFAVQEGSQASYCTVDRNPNLSQEGDSSFGMSPAVWHPTIFSESKNGTNMTCGPPPEALVRDEPPPTDGESGAASRWGQAGAAVAAAIGTSVMATAL